MTDSAATLYRQLAEAGQEMDNHESDLYVKETPEALELVAASGRSWYRFISQVDGLPWIEVPFSFDPFWDRVAGRNDVTRDYLNNGRD